MIPIFSTDFSKEMFKWGKNGHKEKDFMVTGPPD